ncbi:MAG TPA: proton-conducting transporter membrane subunit [Ktedonobacterales bacterium]|nr:proton-conducting transporter membrane subunit [Ktedonobacterales bacterium]
MANTDWLATVAPPLPFAVPLLVAAALAVVGSHTPRWLLDGLATLTALVVTALCAALVVRSTSSRIVYAFGGWQPRKGISLGVLFAIDPIGAGLATLAGIAVTAALVFSWRYFEAVGELYHVLMLVFLAAMVGFCLTGDLFNLFVFFELMGVAAYALTGYKIEESGPLQGALNFAITNSIGAFLILFGIGFLYARTGALNLAQIGRALAGRPVDGLVIAAFTLITIGFLVKAAIVPFHFWLPDAHAVAPSPVCVLFSSVMVELGLYAVARIYWTVFAGALGPYANTIRVPLMALGILTALVGAVMATLQHHIKRMLAFSTVSHAGMFLLGFALLTPLGLAGVSIYVMGHAFIKGALFLSAGILLHQLKSVDENALRGRGRRMPVVGVIFGLGGLSLASLPPLTLFLGKGLIEASASSGGYLWMTAIIVVAEALTGGAILRAAGSVFLGWGEQTGHDVTAANEGEEKEPESGEPSARVPLVMLLPAVVLLIAGCVVGLIPSLAQAATLAAARFVDQRGYIMAVLGVAAGARGAASQPPTVDIYAIVSAFVSVGGALVYALVALFWRRAPALLRRGYEWLTRPTLDWLQTLQSGHPGDYVVWLLTGAAILGVFYTLTLR